ncbi:MULTISPECIES: hypothetical protein [unclassified Microbacterium]|uniref:hypothetical protein n=1 Tax=unclassified Microbacterium TaxID=2609290 RepID=UPI000CFB1C6D|nr:MULTISPECIES: hypothetical protein [unclassified Microbacterium]PQZ48521.1 hypothetical protein CQ032_20165 [Microbacterium sp. MYb43]PQZ69244.1 hypothetical protein CQ031_20115 [Microbacterium sp. MYb40]PRB13970.1 hypothetical protein CQ040_20200 [Microbacterium sp. MYb54]PRB20053.1 hypothetical protein CQ037_20110 [Microbacterium sp. MYb50]PRB57798.1 hypothetical protein CQ021_20175 [Microbacterium sp. MYb24]
MAAAETSHTARWARDYENVEQARVAAAEAFVLLRRTAEEAHQSARQEFTRKHGVDPTPTPPAQLREAWKRDAVTPGTVPELDTARKQAAELRTRLERMQREPAPTRPTRPTIGTPEQEAANDARYLQLTKQRARKSTSLNRDADNTRNRTPSRGFER